MATYTNHLLAQWVQDALKAEIEDLLIRGLGSDGVVNICATLTESGLGGPSDMGLLLTLADRSQVRIDIAAYSPKEG